MNWIDVLIVAILTAVNEVTALNTFKFRKGGGIAEKVCVEKYRVFTHVGVPSSISCATVCSRTNGCEEVYYSAVDGACTGCKKTLAHPSMTLVTSTAHDHYRLVIDKVLDLTNGTSRYSFNFNKQMDFTNAKKFCQQIDANLVVPSSQNEQDFLAGALIEKHTGGGLVWIGISDLNNTGLFLVEHSGQMLNYSCWASGQPWTNGGYHRCAVYCHGINRNSWFTRGCSWGDQYVVCENDETV